ncbi:unnamed protein product [Ixodes hexagonus]
MAAPRFTVRVARKGSVKAYSQRVKSRVEGRVFCSFLFEKSCASALEMLGIPPSTSAETREFSSRRKLALDFSFPPKREGESSSFQRRLASRPAPFGREGGKSARRNGEKDIGRGSSSRQKMLRAGRPLRNERPLQLLLQILVFHWYSQLCLANERMTSSSNRWLPGYGEPMNDVRSDVFNATGQYDGGVVTLRFSRKLDTGDEANDLGFTEDRCLHLVFPVWGGTYNSVLRKLGRHARSPHVSKLPLCLQGCRPPPPPPQTPPPVVPTSPPPAPPTRERPVTTNVRVESSDACSGSWRFPESCSGDSCEYTASWSYHGPSDQVLFTVSTRSNKWTGIGFSSNRAMPKTDAILGWVEETGRFFIMDVWMDGYESPLLDPVQDVGNMSGSRQDGRTTLSFARRRYSGDAMYDLDLDQCLYLVFPTHGGVFNAVSKKIRHHEQTPLVSHDPVCFMHCHPGATVPTRPPVPETRATSAPSTVAPPLEEYRVKLQLLEPWQASYGVKGSRPFTLLNRQLVDGLEPALNEVVQKHQLRLTRVTREPDGLVAEMRLLLAADAEPTEVAQALQAALQPGLLGAVRVNPASLTVHSSNAPESRPKQSAVPGVQSGTAPDSSQAKLYAVVAAVGALVLLLLVQAAAMACRRKRQPQPPAPNREKLLASSHWKDYSTTASSNYSYENFALRAEDDLGPPAGAPHRPASATYERGSTAAVRPQANPYATAQRTPHQAQELNPDFYFMPHQRRYSGEVVRVFVDYSNPEYTGGAK